MDIVKNMLLVTEWPTGFWPNIIKWFAGVGSIAVGIILLTLALKTILFPLDFWQKRSSRKMTAQQALMKPELDEIQAKYQNNPEMMKYKQQEVYKKYNTNKSVGTGCVGMLVYMIVTMLIFFTLFSGLTNISRSKINYEYNTLKDTYITTYNNAIDENSEEEARALAQAQVTAQYEDIKEGFLSIKNIWRPDNWSTVFPDGDQFLKSTGTKFGVYEYTLQQGENESDTIKVKYVYISTNSEKLKDVNGNEYILPYQDIDGRIYVIHNAEDITADPESFTITTADGEELIYDNLVYSTIFKTYENTDLEISYFYLTESEKKTYTKDEKEYVMPYIVDNTIYATSGTATEVTIGDKTYTVDYSKTEEDLLGTFEKEKQQENYNYNSSMQAIDQFVEDYNLITAGITEKYDGQWNGYLVLVILAGGITFLSSWFSTLGVKTKDKDGNTVKGARPKPLMGIILAGVMVFFTISYTSAFAIYIVTNSLISMLYNFLSNILLNKLERKQGKTKKGEVVVADYVRR